MSTSPPCRNAYSPPQGHHWGVAIVSLFFVAFRIGVRVKYFRRIWADDIMVIGACLMIFATACIYQSQATSLYKSYPLVIGKIPPTPENLANETTLLRAEVTEYYLFYTALWTVKLSLLVFFRRLFWDRQRAPFLKA